MRPGRWSLRAEHARRSDHPCATRKAGHLSSAAQHRPPSRLTGRVPSNDGSIPAMHTVIAMPRIVAQHCALISAPTDAVYDVLRDYEVGHPAILPPEHFSRFEIEHGGRGEGTIVRFAFTVLGATSLHRIIIREPEPGRRLVEMNPRDGTCTTFLLHAASTGETRLTIRTDFRRPGITGWLMRAIVPSTLRRVYAKEARNLMTLLGTGDAIAAPA